MDYKSFQNLQFFVRLSADEGGNLSVSDVTVETDQQVEVSPSSFRGSAAGGCADAQTLICSSHTELCCHCPGPKCTHTHKNMHQLAVKIKSVFISHHFSLSEMSQTPG